MMFIEPVAAAVLDGIPVPTVCMLQAVMRAVMSAVAAMSEKSRILALLGRGVRCQQHPRCCARQYPGKRRAALCSVAQVPQRYRRGPRLLVSAACDTHAPLR